MTATSAKSQPVLRKPTRRGTSAEPPPSTHEAKDVRREQSRATSSSPAEVEPASRSNDPPKKGVDRTTAVREVARAADDSKAAAQAVESEPPVQSTPHVQQPVRRLVAAGECTQDVIPSGEPTGHDTSFRITFFRLLVGLMLSAVFIGRFPTFFLHIRGLWTHQTNVECRLFSVQQAWCAWPEEVSAFANLAVRPDYSVGQNATRTMQSISEHVAQYVSLRSSSSSALLDAWEEMESALQNRNETMMRSAYLSLRDTTKPFRDNEGQLEQHMNGSWKTMSEIVAAAYANIQASTDARWNPEKHNTTFRTASNDCVAYRDIKAYAQQGSLLLADGLKHLGDQKKADSRFHDFISAYEDYFSTDGEDSEVLSWAEIEASAASTLQALVDYYAAG